jgi:hypothetical protein
VRVVRGQCEADGSRAGHAGGILAQIQATKSPSAGAMQGLQPCWSSKVPARVSSGSCLWAHQLLVAVAQRAGQGQQAPASRVVDSRWGRTPIKPPLHASL